MRRSKRETVGAAIGVGSSTFEAGQVRPARLWPRRQWHFVWPLAFGQCVS